VAKLSILAGSTSQSITLFLQNSASLVGAGLTGLAYNTSGLTAYYVGSGTYATPYGITLATLSSTAAAWTSGGFIEIDSVHMPGVYRFDISNAVVDTSRGRAVVLYLSGAANLAPNVSEIELTGNNNQTSDDVSLLDAANGVETGYTLRQALRIMLSALGGKVSGASGTTVTFRNVTDAKARITATVDASGNRTAVTLDGA